MVFVTPSCCWEVIWTSLANSDVPVLHLTIISEKQNVQLCRLYTHSGLRFTSQLLFAAWLDMGLGWAPNGPKGLPLSDASWEWGRGAAAERTGETPDIFTTCAGTEVTFWKPPKGTEVQRHRFKFKLWWVMIFWDRSWLLTAMRRSPGWWFNFVSTSSAFFTVPWIIKAFELCSRVKPYSWNETQVSHLWSMKQILTSVGVFSNLPTELIYKSA